MEGLRSFIPKSVKNFCPPFSLNKKTSGKAQITTLEVFP